MASIQTLPVAAQLLSAYPLYPLRSTSSSRSAGSVVAASDIASPAPSSITVLGAANPMDLLTYDVADIFQAFVPYFSISGLSAAQQQQLRLTLGLRADASSTDLSGAINMLLTPSSPADELVNVLVGGGTSQISSNSALLPDLLDSSGEIAGVPQSLGEQVAATTYEALLNTVNISNLTPDTIVPISTSGGEAINITMPEASASASALASASAASATATVMAAATFPAAQDISAIVATATRSTPAASSMPDRQTVTGFTAVSPATAGVPQTARIAETATTQAAAATITESTLVSPAVPPLIAAEAGKAALASGVATIPVASATIVPRAVAPLLSAEASKTALTPEATPPATPPATSVAATGTSLPITAPVAPVKVPVIAAPATGIVPSGSAATARISSGQTLAATSGAVAVKMAATASPTVAAAPVVASAVHASKDVLPGAYALPFETAGSVLQSLLMAGASHWPSVANHAMAAYAAPGMVYQLQAGVEPLHQPSLKNHWSEAFYTLDPVAGVAPSHGPLR